MFPRVRRPGREQLGFDRGGGGGGRSGRVTSGTSEGVAESIECFAADFGVPIASLPTTEWDRESIYEICIFGDVRQSKVGLERGGEESVLEGEERVDSSSVVLKLRDTIGGSVFLNRFVILPVIDDRRCNRA